MKGKKVSGLKNAFTLIEVMVAAILISVVGLSLLQMHQNSAEMGHTMQKKFKHSDWVLIAVFESEVEKVTKNTRFDTLVKPFNIDKRPIREGLNHNVKITTDLVERIGAADITDEIEEQSSETRPIFEGLSLEVYKQNIQMEHETYSVYRVLKP